MTMFPVKAMSTVYRGKFLQALQQMINKGEVILPADTDGKQLFNLLYQKDWIVYAKAPFGGPHAVIEYLGRYTHKVATCLAASRSVITGYAVLMMKKAASLLIIKIMPMMVNKNK